MSTTSTVPMKRRREEYFAFYDELDKKVRDSQAEALRGNATDEGLERIREMRELHLELQREQNRDTKVHLKDSETFYDVCTFVAMNARNVKLEEGGASLDRREFFLQMQEYPQVTEEGPSWTNLGLLYYRTSNKATTLDSLNGPLFTEKKVRATPVRRVDDTGGQRAVTAKEMRAKDISNDTEKNTAYMVRQVFDQFRKKDIPKEGINFLCFFINPWSFSQSVENLFFTSFLIKDGKLKLYMYNGEPTLKMAEKVEDEEEEETVTKHHISRLDMGTWKRCIERYNIEKPFLGHRVGDEDAVPVEDL